MRAIILNLIAHTVIPLNYAIAKYLSAEIPIFQKIKKRLDRLLLEFIHQD